MPRFMARRWRRRKVKKTSGPNSEELMKIAEIEHTPNPNAMKFVLNEPITQGFVTRSFEDFDDASDVPLAKSLFAIDHVISVYFADRWITVTQDGGAAWPELMR